MRTIGISILVLGLTACSPGERSYEMTKEQARGKLMTAKFEKGILPGSSSLTPRVKRDFNGNPEWHVLSKDDGHGSGWWCPLSIEPASEDGKRVKVVNKCDGLMATKDNANLDELVDATLTGRKPKFD